MLIVCVGTFELSDAFFSSGEGGIRGIQRRLQTRHRHLVVTKGEVMERDVKKGCGMRGGDIRGRVMRGCVIKDACRPAIVS